MLEKYLTFSQGGWKGQVLDGFQAEIDLGNLEEWARSSRTSIQRELPLRGIYIRERPGKSTWYYKILRGLGDEREDFLHSLKWRFRPSRFLHVFKISQQLQEAGFLCPRIILAARKRTWWPFGQPTDFIVLETAPGRQVSACFDCSDGNPKIEGKERQEMLRRIGRELARLHQAGFVHGDCHPGNYFWDKGTDSFCYIDNDRTRRCSRMNVPGAIRNLVSAGYFLAHKNRITRDEWDTILNAYLESTNLPQDFCERVNGGIRKRLDAEKKSMGK